MSDDRPARVAIVGGGCAGLAAAFELTRPEHNGAFEVTVYQEGWRLGGKAASGRGPAGRVEEHGLHLWLGYYENAFRLIRECYAELDRDPSSPVATWRDAFSPLHAVGVMESSGPSSWSPWLAHFPPNAGIPGEPGPVPLYEPTSYLERLVGMAAAVLRSAFGERADRESLTALPAFALLGGAVQVLEFARSLLSPVMSDERLVQRLLDTALSSLRAVLVPLLHEPAIRRTWEVAEIALANARGIIADRLLQNPDGFDAINGLDYRQWLRRHGASESSVQSPFIRGLYDLCFAYRRGDPADPQFAAGQALRCAMRAFFTYRGAFLWKMHGGMGDIVIAPYFEVLSRRGVQFRFFHRLSDLRLGRDGSDHWVESLHFDVQADVQGGEYRPLIQVRGLPCWPSKPDFSQLHDGDSLATRLFDFQSSSPGVRSESLQAGRDFDFVILAVGLGEIPRVAGSLVDADQRWRRMVERVETVATQAFQVWLKRPMRELSGQGEPAAVSGFGIPFETWADMSHLVPREDWAEDPAAIAYFCSVLAEQDGQDLAGAHQTVRTAAIRHLETAVPHIWPRARTGEGFPWEWLCAPDSNDYTAGGPARFDTQYWRANVHPSDRYVLSLPGTIDCRISPLDTGFSNLTVAGDWTDCGFNCGCIEAAVISGRLAAHALSGSPRLEDIPGFDHP